VRKPGCIARQLRANLLARVAQSLRASSRCARAFVVTGTDALSATVIYDWCFARRRHHPSGRRRHSVWRILREIADPVERVPPYGAWLWRLRQPPEG
jgi:hypothetical protein